SGQPPAAAVWNTANLRLEEPEFSTSASSFTVAIPPSRSRYCRNASGSTTELPRSGNAARLRRPGTDPLREVRGPGRRLSERVDVRTPLELRERHARVQLALLVEILGQVAAHQDLP